MKQLRQDEVIELLEAERRRLARDIHDGPAQYLTNSSMRLEVIKRLIEGQRVEDAVRELDRLQSIMRGAINDVRRMIFDLRPTFLERGVHDAICLYAERFSQTFGIVVSVTGDWSDLHLSRAVEVALFRVVQEALNNVHKHAKATEVQVTLEKTSVHCQIQVKDNGVGFENTVAGETSFGLRGMQERVSLVSGAVDVKSVPGQGTCVTCEVPIHYE